MADYRSMHLPQLREEAEKAGLGDTSDMNKADLVEALSARQAGGGSDGAGDTGGTGGTGDTSAADQSHPVTGDVRGHRIGSTGEHEEHEGETLVTTDHEVIRRWAEEREARPATVPGTGPEDRAGVLRFDFPGYGGEGLEHISWDEWFQTFEVRGLNFIYQEHLRSGKPSNFFRLENPDREDA